MFRQERYSKKNWKRTEYIEVIIFAAILSINWIISFDERIKTLYFWIRYKKSGIEFLIVYQGRWLSGPIYHCMRELLEVEIRYIYQESNNAMIRKYATERISDKNILSVIITDDPNIDVRLAALIQYRRDEGDDWVLVEAIKSEQNWKIIPRIITLIKNRDALNEVREYLIEKDIDYMVTIENQIDLITD